MLTIVIPTSNRPTFLYRLLAYYADLDVEFRIIVADSSKFDKQIAPSAIKRFESRINLDYRISPVETPILGKILSTIQTVETQYVVLNADDDFFVPGTLDQAVDFLETHPDYSLAHGYSLVFTLISGGSAHGTIRLLKEYPQRSIEHASGADRLIDHLPNYTTTWYSVQRIEQLVSNIKRMGMVGVDGRFSELMTSSLSVIQGKVKKLDRLYMVRQADASKQYTISRFSDWATSPTWNDQFRRVQDCLALELEALSGRSSYQAKGAVQQAFAKYVLKGAAPAPKWKENAERVPGVHWLWCRIRNLRMRSLYKENGPYSAILRDLLDPASPYHNDFMPIYRAITIQEQKKSKTYVLTRCIL